MKRKINLTELRHLETSKEEMGFVKGGDEPDRGPVLCQVVCDCTTACIKDHGEDQEQKYTITKDGISGSTKFSFGMDVISFFALRWIFP